MRACEESPTTAFSVLSWNLLSDIWYQKERYVTYGHVNDEYGDLEMRSKLLLNEWLSPWTNDHDHDGDLSCRGGATDVLAFQEVDYDRFETDMLPALRDAGYEGTVQKPKKKSPNQPCGTATFWRTDRFRLRDEASFSRSLVVSLTSVANRNKNDDEPASPYTVNVVNVHLEAAQTADGADKRARQLNSPLAWAASSSSSSESAATIVCGDFNTGADASLFTVLREHAWHGSRLVSAYEHPAAYDTLPVRRATYAVPGRRYVIDHVLYGLAPREHGGVGLELRCLLNALNAEETTECLGEFGTFDKGLPNAICPSDHLPVGACFEVVRSDAKEEAKNQEENVDDDDLDEERRRRMEEELETILTDKPPPLPRGKPSPDEISARREFAARLRAWRTSYDGESSSESAFAAELIKKTRQKGA